MRDFGGTPNSNDNPCKNIQNLVEKIDYLIKKTRAIIFEFSGAMILSMIGEVYERMGVK